MIQKCILFSLIFMLGLIYSSRLLADIYTWQAIFMNEHSREMLQQYVKDNKEAHEKWLQIKIKTEKYAEDEPNPIEVIHYEGLLDNNPKRKGTVAALMDMRKLAHFYYAYIITQKSLYQKKIKEYVLAWTNKYQATGNPINENKFEAIYLSYYITRSNFSVQEQKQIEQWIKEVADAEINRNNIPMNNWQAKRIKLILYSGIILNDERYKKYALEKYKEYIDHSLRDDGTSRDLEQRDALAYHVSGLKPMILLGIVYDQFKSQFSHQIDPFTDQSENGSSIKKSVDFVIPYARGEKQHEEWVNSKVKLDHERAKAGLEKYKKGRLFEPSKSLEMYELALYFDRSYQSVIDTICKQEKESNNCKGWMYYVVSAIGD